LLGPSASVSPSESQEVDPLAKLPALATRTTALSSSQLDLTAAARITQAVTSELVFDKLVERLMRTLIEHAGAQRGFLVVDAGDRLLATAAVTIDADAVHLDLAEDIDASDELAAPVVHYVARSHEIVLLDNATEDRRFRESAYVARVRPKSILCVPMVHQGRLSGILYLENNAVTGAFNFARVDLIRFLAAHAAVAIENARLYEKATEAIRIRDDFLSIAGHELKTPLTALLMNVDMIARTGRAERLAPRLIEFATKAVQSGVRLGKLIDDLLDVSRMSAGRLRLELSLVELADVARDVAARLAEQLSRAGCELRILTDGESEGLWDRARLDQIVMNLLTNAMKFGSGKPIEIRIGGDGETAHIIVRDQGVGIPLEDQLRIFGRFERATTSRHIGGLGLGLWIARQIVEAHGGSIGVRSELGSGATFTVTLPSAPRAAADSDPASDAMASSHETILSSADSH
jgi:signal transduction histidine kinase